MSDERSRPSRPPVGAESGDAAHRGGPTRWGEDEPERGPIGVDPMQLVSVPHSRRFREVGEVARGGMGSVRRVYDTVLRREVAMKVCEPGTAMGERQALRFVEEAQITGQLDHPNVVSVHDLGIGPGGTYFTMKLVAGETLTARIARLHERPYDHRELEQVLQIFLKVCDALSFAHSRGVVHRDVKPDNVMVGSHGQVYLMDWGVALLVEPGEEGEREGPHVTLPEELAHDREESGAIVGTFEYMAPEQAWGRTSDIDPRTDVFGLGGVLYQLLTGRPPNAGATAFDCLQRAQQGRVAPPESRGAWPHLPPGLCRITERALARLGGDRYPSVAALRADVEDFLRGGGWFDTRTFPAGTVIVQQGDGADSAYIIVSGTCEAYKGPPGPGRTVLRVMGPGEVFGETAVLTGEARTASVSAVDDVTVKVVTRDALERELSRDTWSGTFVRALARRFRDVDAQLTALRDERK